MKRIVCLFAAFLLLLCGCSQNVTQSEKPIFTKSDSGIITNEQGVEYVHLANEGVLYYLGDLVFVGAIKGEAQTSQHLSLSYQTGMFAIQGADDDILVRHAPNNEWFLIYRKASLPKFDCSVDNCTRLKYVPNAEDATHTASEGGITGKSEVSATLAEIRSQENPKDAGLYDLVRKPDGLLENCYYCGIIYGYFEEEPNLVVQLDVLSFNDLGYSVMVDNKEYVIPAQLLEHLQ